MNITSAVGSVFLTVNTTCIFYCCFNGLHVLIQMRHQTHTHLIQGVLQEKGKAIPVTGHGVPYGCETSRIPHFLDNRLTDGNDVVSLKIKEMRYIKTI
jgi:hypothetical protein